MVNSTYKRLRILAPQAVQPAGPFSHTQHRKVGSLDVACSGASHPLVKRLIEMSLSLRDADARSQPAHDFDPVVILIQVVHARRGAHAGSEHHVGVQWNIDVGRG